MNKYNIIDIPDCDPVSIEQTIKISKNEFNKQLLEVPMNGMEFLFQQMLFIGKRYYLIQLSFFLFASIGFMFLHLNGAKIDAMSYAAVYAPLLIIFSIPELWKNIKLNAFEIENTTYFNLRKVYLARFLLFGMFDLLAATLLILMMSKMASLSIYQSIVYFFVPFNLTCCISFSALCCKKKLSSELTAAGGCAGGACLWYVLVNNYKIYDLLELKLWYFLLIISMLYIIFSANRMIKLSKSYLEVEECNCRLKI